MKIQLIIQELVTSFKKYLISSYVLLSGVALLAANILIPSKRTGQAIMEYFLLFGVIIALTVIGVSTFFPRVQAGFNEIQNASIERINHADGNWEY